MKKILTILLSVVAAVTLALGIASCAKGEVTYTVTVQSVGQTPLEGVTVRALLGGRAQDARVTDAEGKVKFTLVADEYTLELSNLPTGYTTQESSYTTDTKGTPVVIICQSTLIGEEMPEDHIYQLGDVMYDYTYTEVETKEVKSLSQLFQTKKAVLLNFWYSGCGPCATEFPLMQEAYEEYKDDLAIVAVNPGVIGNDTSEVVLNYKLTRGLTFDFAIGLDIVSAFNTGGYPTNVMIDRYGVICMIEEGAIFDANIFRDLFETYTSDDYEQNVGGDSEIEKPNIPNPPVEEIADAINNTQSGFDFAYRWDTDSEYSWPWIVSADGESIQTTNADKNGTWAIIYTDITLEEDQVVAFDYRTATEAGNDIFYVFIDGEIIHEFSGSSQTDWSTCYAYVGNGDGAEHELALAYVKDAAMSAAEDTVYVKNMRLTTIAEMAEEGVSFDVLRQAATGYDDSDPENPVYTKYVDVVYNAEDGYYHVGTVDGPYLLADMIEDTNWGYSIYSEALRARNEYAAETLTQDDPRYVLVKNFDLIEDYAWLTRFSDVMLTPVTQELKLLLQELTAAIGNDDPDDEETEWLEVCRYYDHYGVGESISDPIRGLRNWNAFTATLNEPNHVNLQKILMPRGLRYKFVPEVSGAYVMYSVGESDTYAWLFDEAGNQLMESDGGEGKEQIATDSNFEIIYEMEAGVPYYVYCAFFDVSMLGEYDFYIQKYDGDFVMSPVGHGSYTTEDDDMGGDIILLTYVDVQLRDGVYYAVDEDGAIISQIVVDFGAGTYFSPNPLTQWIEQGWFNWTAGGRYAQDDAAWYNACVPQEYRKDYTQFMQEQAATASGGYVTATEELIDVLKVLMALEDRLTDNAWTQLSYYMRPLNVS